jgi:hypothetical protein
MRWKRLGIITGSTFLSMAIGILLVSIYLSRPQLPDDPDQLILFSLDGKPAEGERARAERVREGREMLHEFSVLGRVEIVDPEMRRKLISSVNADIRRGAVPSKCFFARHALQIIKNGKTMDILICFECNNYGIYEGEFRRGMMQPIGESSKPLFNAILSEAQIQLAE